MAQHARLINGRLLLAGRRPWHEWPATDLLDMCDALREDEYRYLISLKAGLKLPPLPDVDTSRLAVRTPAGYGYLPLDATSDIPDDGSWEEDGWEPPTDADSSE